MSEAFTGVVLFWHSLVLGVVLGVVYDLLRIRRIATAPGGSFGVPRKPISLSSWDGGPQKRSAVGMVLLLLEDLCFALLAAILFLLLFYSLNDGAVRWFAFAAAGGSFYIYRLTVGRLLMCLSDRIILWVRIALKWIWGHLIRPVLSVLLAPFRFCVMWLVCAGQVLSGRWREQRLLRMARKGQIPFQKEKGIRKKKKRKKEA